MSISSRLRAVFTAILFMLVLAPTHAFAQAKLVYDDGQAIADARGQILALTIDGSQVQGKFRTAAVCGGSTFLAGGEGSFQAVLSGVWESPSAVIAGTWTGVNQPCSGAPVAVSGTITIVLGPARGTTAVVATLGEQAAPGGPAVIANSFVFTPKNQQVADGGPAGGLAAVDVTYADGRAIQDARTQAMTLTFRGGRVTGTLRTDGVCTGGLMLAGGEATIEAVLLGPWEGRASVIEGSWGGVNTSCQGAVTADRGTIRIVMNRKTDGALGILVTIAGLAEPTPNTYQYTPQGRVFVPGLFEAPGAGVPLTYANGEAWLDQRTQTMALNFAEDRVWGTIDTASVCDAGAGIFLAGGEATVEAELRGPWEGQGSMIFGSWGGDDAPCGGAAVPDRGDICIFLGPSRNNQSAVLARFFGEDGSNQDYVHGPLGKSVALGLSPGAVGRPVSTIDYGQGRAWADSRTDWLSLSIQGNRVFGTMRVDPVCDATTSLTGGDLTLEGTISGDWEAPGTILSGFWGGYGNACGGGSRQDFGTFAITLGPTPGGDPGVIVELADLTGGTQAYFHAPAGKVAAAFGGAPFVGDPFVPRAILGCDLPVPGTLDQYIATGVPGAGPGAVVTPDRDVASSIVLLLDASGSMADEGRMDQAKASARRILGEMTGDVEVALIVFYDCGSVTVAAPFTTDPGVISAALEPVQPTGGTPLAEGIGFAKEYLRTEASGATLRLVVLTDGEESCSGDLMQAVGE
jgi:hypothetical protein